MTVEEIFSKMAAHMIKGLMVHDQLADYFHFLSLEGYHLEQEHQYLAESKTYRDLAAFYTHQYGKLLKSDQVEDPKVIPQAWYKYDRMDVDISTKRNGIEAGFKIWKDWENETVKLYSELMKELYTMGDIPAYCYLMKIIETVNSEFHRIVDRILVLAGTNYDMTYISEAQEDLIEKFKD